MSEKRQEYWIQVIGEQEASGVSVRRFCRERGIGDHSFYMWRKRLRTTPPSIRFALLETKPSPTSAQKGEMELVFASGEVLRIGNGADAATLRLVIETVRS